MTEVRVVGLAKLKQIREAKSLSLAELAERSGVTKNTIYRLEHGAPEPYPSTVRKLAEALGVQPNDLRGSPGDAMAVGRDTTTDARDAR